MKVKEIGETFLCSIENMERKRIRGMKNKKKLLLVSHCILNVRSKIQYAVEFETEEERNRKAFLKK